MVVSREAGLGVTQASPSLFPSVPQICIQVLARQPHSLSLELTGTCSLLAPDLRPQAQVSFSDLGKDWTFAGLGQL